MLPNLLNLWSLEADPRVNIQNNKGKAKAYQIKQVLKALERLELENATKKWSIYL